MNNKKSDLIQKEKDFNSSLGDMTTVPTIAKTASGAITELNSNKVANSDLEPKTTGGTATAYTITLSNPNLSQFVIVPHLDSGATPTLSINGGTGLTIVKQDGSAVGVGDIKANKPLSLVRVGSNFFILSSSGMVKSIQHGMMSFAAYNNPNKATINAVDTSKSIVMVNCANLYYTQANLTNIRAKISNSTTVELYWENSSGSSDAYVAWTVIEFESVKSLQKGTTIAQNTSTGWFTKDITFSAVNMAKAFIVITFSTTAASSNIMYRFTANNTLRVSLYGDTSNKTTLEWQVIEFN